MPLVGLCHSLNWTVSITCPWLHPLISHYRSYIKVNSHLWRGPSRKGFCHTDGLHAWTFSNCFPACFTPDKEVNIEYVSSATKRKSRILGVSYRHSCRAGGGQTIPGGIGRKNMQARHSIHIHVFMFSLLSLVSTGFWRWYITHRILDFFFIVRYSKK
jgi:hypothetical protein